MTLTSERTDVRTLTAISILGFVLAANYVGIVGILLPVQVRELADGDKVGYLAGILAASSLVTALAQPLIGWASDRTRGRWGRRRPWVAAGAAAALLLLLAQGVSAAVIPLALSWIAVQLSLNVVDLTSSVMMKDRFAARRRARVAAVLAIAGSIGGVTGSILAAAYVDRDILWAGYVTLGALVAVAAALFWVLAVDPPASKAPTAPDPERLTLRGSLTAAFAWFLAARFLIGLAYQAVAGFTLYILIDHVLVDSDAAPGVLVGITLVSVVATIVSAAIAGWVSDRTGRRREVIAVGAALMAAGLLVPALSPTLGAVVVCSVGLGIAMGAIGSAGSALVFELLPQRVQAAQGLGYFTLSGNIAQILAPGVTALAVAVAGFGALFAVSAVAALLAGTILIASRTVPDPAEPAAGPASHERG